MKSSSIGKFILSIFLFSWFFWGIAIASGKPSTTFPTVIFYMLGGSAPTLVALFYQFRYCDKEARREFWSRLIDPRRIRPLWWLLCLLTIPLLILIAMGLDLLWGGIPSPMPNLRMLIAQPSIIPVFVIMMLVGGALSEELGWRGVVLDAFQNMWTPLFSTVVLSLIWCIFHLPLFFIRGTAHYEWGVFTPMFWLFFLNVIPLTGFLTLAYNHTNRSILSAVMIHFSYNLMLALVVPVSVRVYGLLAILLAVLDAVIVLADRRVEQPANAPAGVRR
jgi:membrane protease YdiL (CAAX protease family)